MVTMKEARDGRSYSCVAKMLNISSSQYRNYESGRSRIPAEIFLKFCKRFNRDPFEIILPGVKYDENC